MKKTTQTLLMAALLSATVSLASCEPTEDTKKMQTLYGEMSAVSGFSKGIPGETKTKTTQTESADESSDTNNNID